MSTNCGYSRQRGNLAVILSVENNTRRTRTNDDIRINCNRLNNSGKSTHASGQIRFSALPSGDRVVIAVQNTGVGIPAESSRHGCRHVAQVAGTHDQAQGGLRIGVSLVETLVELHGGVVGVTRAGIDQGGARSRSRWRWHLRV